YSSFMEAKEIDSNSSYLNASLADYYKTQEDSSFYTQFINELLLNNKIDLNVKSNIILDYVAYYLNNNGNVENAIEIIKSLIENGEQKSELHLALANILAKYDYEKEAIEQFKIAMQLEPTNREAWIMMMEFQMKKGRYSDLLQSVEDVLVYFPNDYVFFLYRGLAYMLVDKDEDAIVAFQEGLKKLDSAESSNPVASSMLYEMLGDSYYKLNQKEKSFEAFENALTQNPQNAGAMNNYAYYLSIEEENLEHAEELSGKSIKLDPNNPIYLDTYAWIYFKMKKYDLAKFYIEQAISYDTTNNVEIIEHYGDILSQSGNEEEALKQWKKAKELGSQSALLDQKIKEKHYIKEKNENK
ncbi:MAG TPA: hypothetical protein DDY68_01315, partial [Porphyromonadaceae bacterium]|nr:hypothetical protein [Porphyromonadaceae bacterium]